jgi:hypothetical protein
MVALALMFVFTFRDCTSADQKGVPTYTKDIAPILFKNCVKCHQPGELASSDPLISYEMVRARAELVKQKVMTREMPPWPADPARSLKFSNDARLSQQDINTIVNWVNAGTPEGKEGDLPRLQRFEDGWRHPDGVKPDLVISLPGDVRLPAEGAIPYVTAFVKVPLSEDRWVVASQTRPSNPAVVHHMALTEVMLPNGMTPTDVERMASQFHLSRTAFETPAVTTATQPSLPDMLAIYTPGSTFEAYTEDSAKLLRGGGNAYMIFNIHYEATGKPETDRSEIALWFSSGSPTHQLFRVNGAGQSIIANGKEVLTDVPGTKAEGTDVVIPPIPPYMENYEITGITGYLEPVTIYQFQPHAHNRGKDFTYTAIYPDGREQTLLSVPKFDHRWQMAYQLETPLKLPAGSKLIVTAHYDNSTMNMHNPAPEKPVYFRDMNQSWDEMFTPFVQLSFDNRYPQEHLVAQSGQREDQKTDVSRPRQRMENGVLKIGEAVGCLELSSAENWLLTHASATTSSETQTSTSAALKAAKAMTLGNYQYKLLGASVFKPSVFRGDKVVVKGILIEGFNEARINVTSLQTLGRNCVE